MAGLLMRWVLVVVVAASASVGRAAFTNAQQGQFGWALAVDAWDGVLVGAPLGGNATDVAGAAYLYACPPAAASGEAGEGWACAVVGTVTPANGENDEQFGLAVAMQNGGSTIAVGAPLANGGAGAVYVYGCSGGGGGGAAAAAWACNETYANVTDGNPGDFVGYALAMNGWAVFAGAPGAFNGTGAVYVLDWTALPVLNWTAVLVAPPQDGPVEDGDQFGFDVSVAGAVLAVAAPTALRARGEVHLFACASSTASACAPAGVLRATGGVAGDFFGLAVSVAGSLIAVGAPFATVGANAQQGAVYLFACNVTASSGALPWTCTQQHRLVAPGGAAGDSFGFAVGLFNVTLVASAISADAGVGAVYVFCANQTAAAWSYVTTVTAPQTTAGAPPPGAPGGFGYTVAIGPGRFVVAAPFADNGQGLVAGYDLTASGGATNCDVSAPFYGPTCIACTACQNGTCYPGLGGNCTCNAGWAGATCSACDAGFFGAGCAPCSACNGVCTGGLNGTCTCAAAGWAAPACNASCADGYFGPNCTACALCTANGGTCVSGRNGTCVCGPGRNGTTCAVDEDAAAADRGYERHWVVIVVVPLAATACALVAFWVTQYYSRRARVRAGSAGPAFRAVVGLFNLGVALALVASATHRLLPALAVGVGVAVFVPLVANAAVTAWWMRRQGGGGVRTWTHRPSLALILAAAVARLDSLEIVALHWFGLSWPLADGEVRWLAHLWWVAMLVDDAPLLAAELCVLLVPAGPPEAIAVLATVLTLETVLAAALTRVAALWDATARLARLGAAPGGGASAGAASRDGDRDGDRPHHAFGLLDETGAPTATPAAPAESVELVSDPIEPIPFKE